MSFGLCPVFNSLAQLLFPPEQVGQAVMSMCEEEETVDILRKAPSPGVDFYSDGGATLRIATYQGYLNGKTPEEE